MGGKGYVSIRRQIANRYTAQSVPSGDELYTSASTEHQNRVIDEFSAIHHADVMVLRSFVGCVLSCKSTLYVGTIQKLFARQPGK